MSRKHRRAVEALAREFGCIVRPSRNGHLRVFVNPAHPVLVAVAPSSPSDHRAMRNLRADLRRAVTEGGTT